MVYYQNEATVTISEICEYIKLDASNGTNNNSAESGVFGTQLDQLE